MLYPIQNGKRNRRELTGFWDFQTDPRAVGAQEGWYSGLNAPRPMAVPGSWNEQYPDLDGYFGLAWYLRDEYIPSAWQGERVYLRVGSANYHADVWINGVRVGSHEGGHLPFAFDITDQVKWDQTNTIAITVENELKPDRVPAGNGTGAAAGIVPGFPRTTYDFYPYAGLHRPVVLYSVPSVSIEDVTVVTELDGKDGIVRVEVERENQGVVEVALRGRGSEYLSLIHI